ncbi:MAG: hypothetical protein VXW49_11610, partial [Pseudomonadota bacterium]|nr:hypothetical protein [Pseudomonadota bacterium]
AIFGAFGVPFATHAVSDAIVIVGLDADMSSGAAVGGRSMRLSAVPRIVYAAKTFGEAERRLANERFDLVILDLMLPDGVVEDLLPRLKGPGRSPTPVIVFYSKEVSRETADGIRAALVKSQTSNDAPLQVIHLAIEKGKEVAEPLS